MTAVMSYLLDLLFLPDGWNVKMKAGPGAAILDHEWICKTGYIDWKNKIERAWVSESTIWANTPYLSGLPFSVLLCETNYSLVYATIIFKLCFSQLSAQ